MNRDKKLLDSLLEGCQVIGPGFRYVYVNEAAAAHGRRPPRELIGRRMGDVYPGIEETPMFAVLRACMERGELACIENRFEFPDGSHGWFELRFERVPEGVFILSIDITQRKNAEASLQRKTRALKALSECNLSLVRAEDEARFVADTCRLAVEEAGYAVAWVTLARDGEWTVAARASRESVYDVLIEDITAAAGRGGGPLATARDSREPIVEHYGGNGGAVAPWWSRARELGLVAGIFLPVVTNGQLVGVLSMAAGGADELDGDPFDSDERALLDEMALDLGFGIVNLRARAEAARLERQAGDLRRAYSTLVDNLPGMAYRCLNHPSWPMLVVSPGCLELTGYTAEQLTCGDELTYAELIVPEDRARVWDTVQAAIQAGRQFVCEYRIRDAEDRERWVWERGVAVRDDDGQVAAVEGFITDVTERKRAVDMLIAAQRLEAVGCLAGGLAHDFNNLLTVIISYGSFVLEGLDASDPIHADVAEILAAADRGASLTRRLLAFSRRQETEPTNIDVSEVIVGLEGLLRRLLGAHVNVVVSMQPVVSVFADPGQIEQIVMNLAVNARDAMPEGGTVTIATDTVDVVAGSGELELPQGRYVRIAVTDTGIGMNAETRAQIFEPLFTTKSVDKGTGLGLSIVRDIVKQLGGEIQVHSAPGCGARFEIYLPHGGGDRTSVDLPAALEVPVGHETVLLVEDDDVMRRLETRILSSAGYRVIAARDGREAELEFSRLGGQVDLLVTDLVMPRIGGWRLARSLRGRRADLRVLYVSGYSSSALDQLGALDERTHFLPKPFSAAELAKSVRLVLDAEAS